MSYVVPFLYVAVFALWGWGAFYAGRRYGFDEGAQDEREQQKRREERKRNALAADLERRFGRPLKVIK